MTLRDRSDRRKAGGYEDDVTPPPTVSRRGRGTGTGSTPRGKPSAVPSTPLARKAVHNSKMASPVHAEDVSMTPTGHSNADSIPTKVSVSPKTPKQTQSSPAIPASQLPPLPPSTNTTPIGHQSETETSPDTPTAQRPRPAPAPSTNAAVSASAPSEDPNAKLKIQQRVVPVPVPVPGPTIAEGGKIMLRFTRPSPLPPSEIPSLPSPITPLPPSHSPLYPHLPHLATSSEHLGIDQRLAYREESASTATSEDYLSAKSIPSEQEQERGKREATQESSASSENRPQMPGGLK